MLVTHGASCGTAPYTSTSDRFLGEGSEHIWARKSLAAVCLVLNFPIKLVQSSCCVDQMSTHSSRKTRVVSHKHSMALANGKTARLGAGRCRSSETHGLSWTFWFQDLGSHDTDSQNEQMGLAGISTDHVWVC